MPMVQLSGYRSIPCVRLEGREMSQISVFWGDVRGIYSACPLSQALKWYSAVLLNFPTILRTRKLYTADRAMTGVMSFSFMGRKFSFDLDGAPADSFSWLREFFVRDNYFCCFNLEKMTIRNFVDLGCNLGRVSQIVSGLYDDNVKILAVDADDYGHNPVRAHLTGRNINFVQALVVSGAEQSETFDRSKYDSFVKKYGEGFNNNHQSITGDEIAAYFGGEQLDMVKLDIEGAEFDLILNNNGWLSKVDNLTMEVHREFGGPEMIIFALQNMGFDTGWRDNHNNTAAMEAADFIYASRTGVLKV
jgi:FkbM family methyltransferase